MSKVESLYRQPEEPLEKGKQGSVIKEFLRLGYERQPRSRAPAVLRKGNIEQHVGKDGRVTTFTVREGGRLGRVAHFRDGELV